MAESLQEKVSQMRPSGRGTQSKVLTNRRVTAYFHSLKDYPGWPEGGKAREERCFQACAMQKASMVA